MATQSMESVWMAVTCQLNCFCSAASQNWPLHLSDACAYDGKNMVNTAKEHYTLLRLN